jgi:TM2 domain-containing membrane protein YozV
MPPPDATGRILQYLPELKGEEQLHVARLMKPMDDEEARQFAAVYRERRRDPVMVLLLVAVGLTIVGSGFQRFYLDQVGMGVLYLLTGGLCFVGTVYDAINYKSLTLRYNRRQADEVAAMVRSTPTADELW